MKIQELLLEYDAHKIESLAPMYAQRQKDLSAPKTTTVSQLADHVEQDLGVKSGEIVFWILHKYLKPLPGNQYGISRWEDVKSRVIPNLRKFEILKNKKKLPPEQRDLNRLKSLSELEAIVDQFDEQELQSQTQQSKSVEQQMYQHGDAKLIHDDAQIKVVQPLTEKGSCYFGINTKWCTAARENNMFDRYHKLGGIYVVLIKKENRRYQFHWAEILDNSADDLLGHFSDSEKSMLLRGSSQFMDEKDKVMNPNLLAARYPILFKIFGPIAARNDSLILNPNPSNETIMRAIEHDRSQIQYVKNPPKDLLLTITKQYPNVISYLDNPSVEVQLTAMGYYDQKKYTNPPNSYSRVFGAFTRIQNPAPEAVKFLKTVFNNSEAKSRLRKYIIDRMPDKLSQQHDKLSQQHLNLIRDLVREDDWKHWTHLIVDHKYKNKTLTVHDVQFAVDNNVFSADYGKNYLERMQQN